MSELAERVEGQVGDQVEGQADGQTDLPTDTADAGFIEPVAMEDDPTELFAGDRGVLDAPVRRVLVRLLRGRYLLADNRAEWTVLLENQQVIESRLHDLFIRLVVDHDRGIAYKRQVRSAEIDVPILLKDTPYGRIETLALVHLRTVYQRESTAGEASARVDIEEVEQTVLTYFPADGQTAKVQKEVRTAMDRLDAQGLVVKESEGRYRITPLVEVVMSVEKLAELKGWLRDQAAESSAVEDAPEAVEDAARGEDQTADCEVRDGVGKESDVQHNLGELMEVMAP